MMTRVYRISTRSILAVLLVGACATSVGAAVTPDVVTYNRFVRPILTDRCFSCHGPDSIQRKASLRFDRPESLFGPIPKDPDKRPFVPGHPEKSEAYRRITSADPDEVMPPAKSHLKLDAAEKQIIRKWIEQGAKWEQYWAFLAPERPAIPPVKDADWCRNDIDRFVLAKLEKRGLHPSPEADRPTLIRRASLALTGLPPTPAEVDAFVADRSSDAYEKVVDRLLASPRYGEQMATRWLDYARYADSHGYQSDPERFMWHWRDWVINAFNRNMPFDEFTVEQLAGDLLPHPTTDQLVATGFNRNNPINDEGGIIAEEWRVEGVLDRVNTTSEVWLGLTMGCCRCHDHKFDPFTQKDYYSLSAFFNSIDETGVGVTRIVDKGANVPPVLKLPTPEQKKQLDAATDKLREAESKLADFEKHSDDRLAAWEKRQAGDAGMDGLAAAFPLDNAIAGRDGSGAPLDARWVGANGPVFKKNALSLDGKGSAVDAGDAVAFDLGHGFSYAARINVTGSGAVLSKMDPAPGYRGFDLRVENGKLEAHLVHQWPGDAIKVASRKAVIGKNWAHVLVTCDGSRKASGVKIYVDGMPVPLKVEKDHLTGSIAARTPLLIGKRAKTDPFKGQIRDVEFFGRALSAGEAAELALRPEIRSITQVPPDRRTPDQKKKLKELFEKADPELADARERVESATKELEELDRKIPDTMVMKELPKPRDTFVLIRGLYDKHGPQVHPALPAVLPPMPPGQPMNRLGLARWLVDPSNPLTARVQANRLWEKFFGVGIVKTSENLGTQADPPSDQELLDYLATDLVALKWDLKAFQKQIVMSATFRQSSRLTPELLERDPENRLLARGPRFRLPAETIRDQALADSGLLVEKIGGPSVRPYEPANLWEQNLYGNLGKYVVDSGDALYRRSLYTFIKRTATPCNLTVFDQPDRSYCVISRSRTDTPLQALDLMNDPTYVEAARVLAERMMKDGGSTPVDRLAYGFRRATCRPPSEAEMRILREGFDKLLARYRDDPKSAEQLLAAGQSPRDPHLDAPELAAYTISASVLLNMDEVVNQH